MFRTLGRIFYGLSLGSIVLSIAMWRQGQPKPTGLARIWQHPDYAASERVATFVGLWAPTLALAGKVLEDLGGVKTKELAKSSSNPQNLSATNGYFAETEKSGATR